MEKSLAEATTEKQSLRPVWVGLGRALGGALIFTLPMLMTMEMWEFGFAMDRWRLLVLLVLSLPMLMFLSHYSGFEATWGWKEDLRDVATALGVGVVVSGVVLWLFGIIDATMPRSEVTGKIALQSVPGALGALLGRSQLGRESAEGHGESYQGEIVVMIVGALFLSLNVAPTEEMVLIAYRMDPAQTLLLPPLALLLMHGFVFASEFKGATPIPPNTPWWSLFLRFTVVGYVVALLTSVYVLWTFGRFDGVGFNMALAISVVLAFPAAVGAAAARLIL